MFPFVIECKKKFYKKKKKQKRINFELLEWLAMLVMIGDDWQWPVH